MIQRPCNQTGRLQDIVRFRRDQRVYAATLNRGTITLARRAVMAGARGGRCVAISMHPSGSLSLLYNAALWFACVPFHMARTAQPSYRVWPRIVFMRGFNTGNSPTLRARTRPIDVARAYIIGDEGLGPSSFWRRSSRGPTTRSLGRDLAVLRAELPAQMIDRPKARSAVGANQESPWSVGSATLPGAELDI